MAGIAKLVVGQVYNGFGGGTEAGWRFFPAHWLYQGETNERLFSFLGGEENCELWDIFGVEPNSVESIGNVNL